MRIVWRMDKVYLFVDKIVSLCIHTPHGGALTSTFTTLKRKEVPLVSKTKVTLLSLLKRIFLLNGMFFSLAANSFSGLAWRSRFNSTKDDKAKNVQYNQQLHSSTSAAFAKPVFMLSFFYFFVGRLKLYSLKINKLQNKSKILCKILAL